MYDAGRYYIHTKGDNAGTRVWFQSIAKNTYTQPIVSGTMRIKHDLRCSILTTFIKSKKVVRDRLELSTKGFSILYSTN